MEDNEGTQASVAAENLPAPPPNVENETPSEADMSSSSSEDDIEITSEMEDPPGTEGMYNVNPGESEMSSDSEDDGKVTEDEKGPGFTPAASVSGDSVATLADKTDDIGDMPMDFPSPPNTVDGGDESPADIQPDEPPRADTFSSSDSSSDDEAPRVIKGKEDDDNELTPNSLRRALEERERERENEKPDPGNLGELGARKPSEPAPSAVKPATPDFMESYSPEAFDFTGDPSLRARTAFDFEDDPQNAPPTLPPKKRDANVPDDDMNRRKKNNPRHNPDDGHPNIFLVKDKNASLGRGMWSDEEESEPYRRKKPIPSRKAHPDRIIDFSNNPDGDHSLQRSRSDRRKNPSFKRSKNRKQSRSRSPGRQAHRVLDFSANPYMDSNGINAQAMVSLRPNNMQTDTDDNNVDSGEELNHLIDKANSLGYHVNYLNPAEDIYQQMAPKERKLESKQQDAFAKIVAPTKSPQANVEKPSRNQTRRPRRAPVVFDEDDTSVAESDIDRRQSRRPSLPFVTDVYPSYNNTEMESPSEAEYTEPKQYDRTSSFVTDDGGREMYRPKYGNKYMYGPPPMSDTETDMDTRANLNPIVSSNFQICSDISGSKSFPARLREGTVKNQRPALGHVAIPLNQASKNRQAYPTSLPYFGNEIDSDYDGLVRSGSVDDVYPIHKPSIVVRRQATHPTGYEPDIAPTVYVQGPPPKKEKKKKKERKEPAEKPVPQINLKVDGESSNLNNNLQINLLPSSDPNVINLNIRSSSMNPTGPQSLPTVMPTEVYTTPNPQSGDNQHRVVDVGAPPVIVTGNPLAASYSDNGGVMLAGGLPVEISPSPNIAPQMYPQLISTQSLPASAPQPPTPMIQTHVSTPPVQQQPVPIAEPTVVTVEAPWPVENGNRQRSSSATAKHSDRMNRGDSGIDLTMHEGHRRSRRDSRERKRRRPVSRSSSRRASSVASSDRGSKRRSSSKRHLKSHDYLGATTPTREYMEWYKDKYLRPSCCYLIMKHVMLALNVIFTLAGLGLVGLGIWGMVGLHQAGISDAGVITKDPLFTVMIVGFVIALTAFHGAAGFIRDNICMLKCFGAFLVTLFVIFMIGGITFWALLEKVEVFAVDTVKELVQQYHPQHREGLTYSIDLMQDNFQCCGMTGAADWARNEMFNCTTGTRCKLPKSCCPGTKDPDLKCTTPSVLHHRMGCNATLAASVRNNTPVIVGAWIGVWALMMIELIIIYFMIREVRYLRKIRNFVKNPVKYMEKKQQSTQNDGESDGDDSSQESSDEDDSETSSSSEEEYRKRRKGRRRGDSRRSRGRKETKRTPKSKGGRKRSHHINRAYSIHDETRSARRSQRDSKYRKRSHSRRRGSF